MDITREEKDGVVILRLNEDVLVENFQELKTVLEELITRENDRIVIDMHRIQYFCSQGLGTITSSLKIIRERGGDIKILNPAGRILKLFELTRLNKILDILQEEKDLKERFQLPTP
ncbi:MAG TPA: STAS domain-containing protein [bacterium]|nr:STAS domain-containing protein [bacterium]